MRAGGLVDQADGLWQPTLASVSESRSSSSPSESLPLGLMSGENRPCEFWGVTCGVSERDAVCAVKSSELSVRSILPTTHHPRQQLGRRSRGAVAIPRSSGKSHNGWLAGAESIKAEQATIPWQRVLDRTGQVEQVKRVPGAWRGGRLG